MQALGFFLPALSLASCSGDAGRTTVTDDTNPSGNAGAQGKGGAASSSTAGGHAGSQGGNAAGAGGGSGHAGAGGNAGSGPLIASCEASTQGDTKTCQCLVKGSSPSTVPCSTTTVGGLCCASPKFPSAGSCDCIGFGCMDYGASCECASDFAPSPVKSCAGSSLECCLGPDTCSCAPGIQCSVGETPSTSCGIDVVPCVAAWSRVDVCSP